MAIIVNFIWLILKTFGKIMLAIFSLIILFIMLINIFALVQGYTNIKEVDPTSNAPILVLGAGVINNEYPSNILRNRLDKAFEIHQILPDNPIIVSGDHREDTYNEVAVMKNYLIELGVDSEQIYQDHAGHSTFDSIYRLKHVIGSNQVIVVTQAYHLHRAIMIAKAMDMEVLGVSAEEISSSRLRREVREIFARVKDFAVLYLNFQTTPPLTDYGFSLEQSGDLTDIKR